MKNVHDLTVEEIKNDGKVVFTEKSANIVAITRGSLETSTQKKGGKSFRLRVIWFYQTTASSPSDH